jgi:hypothetical protein
MLMTEELLMYVWDLFQQACTESRLQLVEPAAWLQPSVLQLCDKLLGDQVSDSSS